MQCEVFERQAKEIPFRSATMIMDWLRVKDLFKIFDSLLLHSSPKLIEAP